MNRLVLFDDFDQDVPVSPRIGDRGRVGVGPDGALTVDLDERAVRTTPADRIGDHLVHAVNTAIDAAARSRS